MELFPAIIALEKLQVKVTSLMVLFVSIGDERLVAEPTFVWLLTSMSLDVMRQRGAMSKDFHAGSVRTLILQDPFRNDLVFECRIVILSLL